MYGNPFEDLKSRLEGKTVIKIEDPCMREVICKFVLSDGTAFRLHATDLGYWIEETEGVNGYSSLHSLLTDYGRHIYEAYGYKESPDAKIVISGSVVEFSAPDGKVFMGDVSKFSEYEQKLLSDPRPIKVLEHCAACGDMWSIGFGKTSTLPEEFRFKELAK
jgi:hypothetical protein